MSEIEEAAKLVVAVLIGDPDYDEQTVRAELEIERQWPLLWVALQNLTYAVDRSEPGYDTWGTAENITHEPPEELKRRLVEIKARLRLPGPPL